MYSFAVQMLLRSIAKLYMLVSALLRKALKEPCSARLLEQEYCYAVLLRTR